MSPDAQHQLQGQHRGVHWLVFIIVKNVQFYLSLENSLCTDYVTEKFWKVLPYNVIPVVLNGANMSNIAPKNSYIDFKDFNNNIAGTAGKGVTTLQVCGFVDVQITHKKAC